MKRTFAVFSLLIPALFCNEAADSRFIELTHQISKSDCARAKKFQEALLSIFHQDFLIFEAENPDETNPRPQDSDRLHCTPG